jgi:hypothetical protein
LLFEGLKDGAGSVGPLADGRLGKKLIKYGKIVIGVLDNNNER